ncbi:sigma factor [Lentzea jiangxiensis]|uniref:DNA-directed RNA polymerase specialized sigma subunit, sigma24 family n=1 Tax=Lentzea jiangxiensis TaxID=641025 RepID=A0A1H0VTT5_9PSEU|nr:sigma factor [Lentzea jiangxiensis]SDP81661.1 DNA-directed RNA polymerase specialized sigma subunit, sigma24 family [Lentzea jiangxiensis]
MATKGRARRRYISVDAAATTADPELVAPLITMMITRNLRDRIPFADLDDVVQGTVAKFLARPLELRSEIKYFSAYITKLATNAAVDYYRARAKEIPAGTWMDIEFLLLGGEPVTRDTFREQRQRLNLLDLAARLIPDMVDAMRLFLDGFNLAEVAEIIGKPQIEVYTAFRDIARRLDTRYVHEVDASTRPVPSGPPQIARAVGALGKRQADVLRMSADGLEPRAIAEVLGIDKNAVRASKSIAIKTIRDQLGLANSAEVLERVRQLSWTSQEPRAS